MDLETENRIAAILMKEAAELRRQAEKEGVHVYLQQNKVRGRPNSQFLTATVLGVQQANRAVEVNEMWRVRRKERELNDKLKGRSKVRCSHNSHGDIANSSRSLSKRHTTDDKDATELCSSSKRECKGSYSRDDEGGLRDEEVEEFLRSRVKRGRGAVGSRMDEAGPYPAPSSDSNGKLSTSCDVWQHRLLGPEKPPALKFSESTDEDLNEDSQKKRKKENSDSSDKKHFKEHKSKEKSKHNRRKRKEKRSKHHG